MAFSVAFKTLGCRLNQFETDAIASVFYENGYKIVDFRNKADAYIINTCTVTGQTDHDSRNLISRVMKKNPVPVIALTGCYVQNNIEMLKKNPDIITVSNRHKKDVFDIVDSQLNNKTIMLPDKEDPFGFHTVSKGLHTRASVKVQDGCNKYCSFCIVPKVRGNPVSRPLQSILENVKKLTENGFKEIVITGVNIMLYKSDGTDLTGLVKKTCSIDGDFRVRISSIEPYNIGNDFYDLFENPKLCRHLHICLQSGSDRILKEMKRNYNVSEFMNIINNIRSRYEHFHFGTDIMVGFPGETEDDFLMTTEIVKEARFGSIHIFRYSERDTTPAATMKNKVPENIKKQRSTLLHEITEKQKLEYYESLIGKIQQVLIEKTDNGGIARGYGEYYVPLTFKTEKNKNEFDNVIITKVEKTEKGIVVSSEIC